jgi:hypothetical protein
MPDEVKVGKSTLSVYKSSSFDETEGLKKESVYKDDDEDEKSSVYKEVIVEKVDNDSHLVFGWANISIQADGSIPLDWQGDITAPKVLEKAAYNFVLKYRATGEQHVGGVKGYLVESVMFTTEKMVAMGIPDGVVPQGWWVGFYIPDDEICEKVKSGEYRMFSIQGRAKKLKV